MKKKDTSMAFINRRCSSQIDKLMCCNYEASTQKVKKNSYINEVVKLTRTQTYRYRNKGSVRFTRGRIIESIQGLKSHRIVEKSRNFELPKM